MAAMELQEIRHAPASPGTGVLLALQRDGVPAEDAPKVKELQTLLAADIEKFGDAALADATTLLRFLASGRMPLPPRTSCLLVEQEVAPSQEPVVQQVRISAH